VIGWLCIPAKGCESADEQPVDDVSKSAKAPPQATREARERRVRFMRGGAYHERCADVRTALR
jgi:hypothetical protein